MNENLGETLPQNPSQYAFVNELGFDVSHDSSSEQDILDISNLTTAKKNNNLELPGQHGPQNLLHKPQSHSNNYVLYDSSNILVDATCQQPCNNVNGSSDVETDKLLLNYVYQVLNSTYEGNFCIACYRYELVEKNKKKLLDTKKRTYFSKNKVAKLIVDNEIYRSNDYHISGKRFLELAHLTCQVFPKLLPESFYTERTPEKSSGGAFQIYYSKLREKEIAIERLLPPKKKIKLEEDDITSEEFKKLQIQVNIIDSKYVKFWSETAVTERKCLYQQKNLQEILQNLPNFNHPAAYTLVKTDFTIIFNKGNDIFNESWKNLAPQIIKIAKSKRTDVDIKNLLSQNLVIKGIEHEKTLALMLLPLLFKRKAAITSKSKTKISWTPQKHEVSKSFIIHLQYTDKLQSALEEAHTSLLTIYNDHKLIISPYVVIFGQSLDDIQAAFVIAEPFKYQFSTPSEAVDVCFQLMKVFKQTYSPISNHVWQFLEKKIYGFEVVNLYSSVTDLLVKLS